MQNKVDTFVKTILKTIFIAPLTSRPISALANHFLEQHVPIFLVHQLVHEKKYGSGITPEHLRNCLTYLTDNGHHFISLETAMLALKNGTPLPKKSVVFTIDDGYYEQMTIAAPIFLEFDCPVTFFVITDMLDQQLWPWDAKASWLINNSPVQHLTINFNDETLDIDISNTGKKHHARSLILDYIKETDAENVDQTLDQLAAAAGITLPDSTPERYKTANWNQARDLESKGVCFAPHSKTHRILSKMRADTARFEIQHSWKRLKEELNNPLNVFCYPAGRRFDYGPREISFLKESDFLGAVSTTPGYLTAMNDTNTKMYSLPRLYLPESMTDFKQYCTWIEHAKASASFY